jgi:hypothetical protein
MKLFIFIDVFRLGTKVVQVYAKLKRLQIVEF